MRPIKLTTCAFILFISATSASAQSEAKPESHFAIGATVGVSFDQWNLNYLEPTGDGITASSKARTGYQGGVSFAYQLSNHWNLKAGLEVQSKHLEYRLDGLHFDQDFNGVGFNDSHIIYNTKATLLSIPVEIEYQFGTSKLVPFVSLGFSGDYVLNENPDGTIYYSNGTTETLPEAELLRKSNLALLAGAGIYYRASSAISISLNPFFHYSLFHEDQDLYTYGWGLKAGIYYNL